ncbi:MAG: MoxR family ATPase [Calditrichaeota bacterium]|nr:MAG: MoxR family ATPase [Calditrichota bacterium]
MADQADRQNVFPTRIDLGDLHRAVEQIRQEIRKIIVGQEEMVELLLAAILADGHVLIEGVPGVAKTLTAKLLARTFSVKFSRIQFTPDLMPSDVVGTSVFNMKTSRFEFNPGPIFANIVLIDEINRAPAKTQSALFEVMEERQVTVDGTTYPLEFPFIAIATQNPIEQEGTYRLPEAQLDRFLFKIEVPYPTLEEEKQILGEFHRRKSVNDLGLVQPVLDASHLKQYREQVQEVHVEERLIDYIALLVQQTRQDSSLYLGASPRAGQNILNAAKAVAALQGRDFITPEDVQRVIFPVLRHRLLLTPEKEMEGVTPDEIIRQLLEKVEVPR